MKRIMLFLVILFSFSGCSRKDSSIAPGMELRQKIASGNGCSFDAEITADYTDKFYTFRMQCTVDKTGVLTFSVEEPETIEGIQGSLSGAGGSLEFDDQALAFSMLADGQITPVSAPWIFYRALETGYLRGCNTNSEGIHMMIDDTYEGENLQVDIYLSEDHVPIQGDILWSGTRILALKIDNFQIL